MILGNNFTCILDIETQTYTFPNHATMRGKNHYSQLPPCGHPAITDTPIIRTADKFRAKINYRHLTEINSRYYGLSPQRTLT